MLLRERRRRASSRIASHGDRRLVSHAGGHLDPQRVWLANITIGSPWWTGLFGDPRAAWSLSFWMPPNVLRFPERRSEVARLRSEIAEMRKSVRAAAV